MKLIARKADIPRLRGGLCHKIFYVAHTTFAKQCLVLLGNKAALALHRLDKALAFKIGIGALVVVTLTPSPSASTRIEGNRSPALRAPDKICALTCEDICS